jgi:hypothetical protein
MGIRWLSHPTAMDLDTPGRASAGTETLAHNQRRKTEFAPRNCRRDLGAITQPPLILAGTADEAFRPHQHDPVVSRHTEADVELMEGFTHVGIVVGPAVRPMIGA